MNRAYSITASAALLCGLIAGCSQHNEPTFKGYTTGFVTRSPDCANQKFIDLLQTDKNYADEAWPMPDSATSNMPKKFRVDYDPGDSGNRAHHVNVGMAPVDCTDGLPTSPNHFFSYTVGQSDGCISFWGGLLVIKGERPWVKTKWTKIGVVESSMGGPEGEFWISFDSVSLVQRVYNLGPSKVEVWWGPFVPTAILDVNQYAEWKPSSLPGVPAMSISPSNFVAGDPIKAKLEAFKTLTGPY